MEMQSANEFLDNPERLNALYAEEGYLFFRNVLDVGAVTDLKKQVQAVLADGGYVAPDSDEPVWTGKQLKGGKAGTAGPVLQAAYDRLELWENFVRQPRIRGFFERIEGEPVEFIPVAYFRNRLPGDDLVLWHQDGYYAQGVGARTAWVPLMKIDESLGGLQLAAGMHRQGYLHDSLSPLPDSAIPQECRRHAGVYNPGDVVVFSETTPHTGLPNVSRDHLFRLSLDVRFLPARQEWVDIGRLVSVASEHIVLASEQQGTLTVPVNAKTVLRQSGGEQIFGDAMALWDVRVGEQVMASKRNGVAWYVRPAVSRDSSRITGKK